MGRRCLEKYLYKKDFKGVVRQEEYWRRDGMLHGEFNYQGNRLLNLYEQGAMDSETFLDYYIRLAVPHLEDAERLATILVRAIVPCSPRELELKDLLYG